MNCCITGLQWGDEGKGKIVDVLAEHSDIVVRYSGGANAGHTVVIGDSSFALHLLPSYLQNDVHLPGMFGKKLHHLTFSALNMIFPKSCGLWKFGPGVFEGLHWLYCSLVLPPQR